MRRPVIVAVAVAVVAGLGAGVYFWSARPQPQPHRVLIEYPDQSTPHSVRVTRFRSAEDAERSAARLRDDLGEPAFVVKVKQGRSVWFETHLGPWASKEDAEPVLEEVKKRGASGAKLADFKAYEKNIDESALEPARKEKRALDPNVVDPEEKIAQELPAPLTESLADVILSFPVNYDLSVVEMAALMPRGAPAGAVALKPFYFPAAVNENFLRNQTNGVVAVKFQDKLYGNRFSMLAAVPAVGEDPASLAAKVEAAVAAGHRAAGYEVTTEREYLRLGDADARGSLLVAKKPGAATLSFHVVSSTAPRAFYLVRSLNETGDDVRDALEGATGEGGLPAYHEVMRTLYAIPVGGDGRPLLLYTFSLFLVGDDYVAAKGYADWAKAMLGYWGASMILEDSSMFMVDIFDLRSKGYAQHAYGLYSNDVAYSVITEIQVRGRRGWYHPMGEVNFDSGRYIVAVNETGADSGPLVRRAEAMQVFAGPGAAAGAASPKAPKRQAPPARAAKSSPGGKGPSMFEL